MYHSFPKIPHGLVASVYGATILVLISKNPKGGQLLARLPFNATCFKIWFHLIGAFETSRIIQPFWPGQCTGRISVLKKNLLCSVEFWRKTSFETKIFTLLWKDLKTNNYILINQSFLEFATICQGGWFTGQVLSH